MNLHSFAETARFTNEISERGKLIFTVPLSFDTVIIYSISLLSLISLYYSSSSSHKGQYKTMILSPPYHFPLLHPTGHITSLAILKSRTREIKICTFLLKDHRRLENGPKFGVAAITVRLTNATVTLVNFYLPRRFIYCKLRTTAIETQRVRAMYCFRMGNCRIVHTVSYNCM